MFHRSTSGRSYGSRAAPQRGCDRDFGWHEGRSGGPEVGGSGAALKTLSSEGGYVVLYVGGGCRLISHDLVSLR